MERKKLRKGVFMVAYSLESGKPEYIIQHRKLHWKGWEFPKAGLKKGESKKEAARREIKEETGLEIIKVTSHKYKGKFLYPKELPDRPGISGQTYYLYSVELKKGKIKVDKKEHTSARWVDYETAMKMLTHQNQKDSLKIVNDWLKDKLNFKKVKTKEKKEKILKKKKIEKRKPLTRKNPIKNLK
ncbi:MAG TPA: NUDIX domain-containing protein [Candidatus Nanoarchaeia archaeon]|nr:NUDIX domain-containing protein [Candidatus Nanoarchaeia archaeon]